MNSSPILRGKHAVVLGAGGSVGAAVAKEFAAEGAEVFLAGRTRSNVEEVTKHIIADGGQAHTATLDALDDAAINDYIDDIVRRTGRIDIMFNAVGPRATEYRNGTHAVDLTVEEFMIPVTTVLKSQFVAARAAARHMVRQGSGVIIFLTGSPARAHVPGATAIGAAFGAIENFTGNLAIELGAAGVRVVCLRSSAMPDTRTIQDTMGATTGTTNITTEQTAAMLADMTLLKMPPRTSDTAKAAVFLASDQARMMTGTVLNSSAGAVVD